jgi:peptide/nickel transport system ATP-binding protein
LKPQTKIAEIENHLLEVKELSIGISSEEVILVQPLTFTLTKGKTLALVGESGSGKSLTSYAIMGLLPKTLSIKSGEINLFTDKQKIDLTKLSPNELNYLRGKEIAMVFQEPMSALNPSYSIGFQLMEAIQNHTKLPRNLIEERAIELLNEVQIPDAKKALSKYPHEMSGGQKQRVVIAMALANNPKILIADEPTTALDVTIQKVLLKLLAQLCEIRKMAMLFITHDLGVVAEIADDVMVLQKGICIEFGSTHKIFKNPIKPYTKGLIACKPPLEIRPKRLLTVSDFLEGNKVEQVLVEPKERQKKLTEIYQKQPLIKITNLSKQYLKSKGLFGRENETVQVLENINFELFKGESLGLVGESGSGKSTLGRCIMRLVEPNSGSMLYNNNVQIEKLTKSQLRTFRRKIQIIFQDPFSALNPNLTVGQAIIEPMQAFNLEVSAKHRKKKALYLLKRVGLDEKAFNRYPHQFSGGQRQRICIARTLALSPEIIICDESVSALDVSVQAQVLNLFNDLKDEFNLTYLFISHDLSVVRYFCDRIMVLRKGEIVELNESDSLFFNPVHPYTKSLLEAIPGKL